MQWLYFQCGSVVPYFFALETFLSCCCIRVAHSSSRLLCLHCLHWWWTRSKFQTLHRFAVVCLVECFKTFSELQGIIGKKAFLFEVILIDFDFTYICLIK